MRLIASLLIIAAAVYIGYVVYTKQSPLREAPDGDAAAVTGEVAGESGPEAPAEPVFKSKIPIPDGPPGEKHYASSNTFYVLERVIYQHTNGIAAIVPGESVRLVKQNPNGTMKVRSGLYEFEVKESQVTNDLDLAREAERKFVLNPPKVR